MFILKFLFFSRSLEPQFHEMKFVWIRRAVINNIILKHMAVAEEACFSSCLFSFIRLSSAFYRFFFGRGLATCCFFPP